MPRSKKFQPPAEKLAMALEFLKEIDIDSILDVSIQPRQPPDATQPERKLRFRDRVTRILQLEEYPSDIIYPLKVLVSYAQRNNRTAEEVKAKLLELVEQRQNTPGRQASIIEILPKDINRVMNTWCQVAARKRAAEEPPTEDAASRSKRQHPSQLESMMGRLAVDDKSQGSGWGHKKNVNEHQKVERNQTATDREDDKHRDAETLPDATPDVQVVTDDSSEAMEVD